jgi:hypothetical protein
MGGRSGRGIRSPIGYASGYQNSFSHAEITDHKKLGAFGACTTTRRATCVMSRKRVHESSAARRDARRAQNRDAQRVKRARRAEASASAAADEISTPSPFASESSAAREARKRDARRAQNRYAHRAKRARRAEASASAARLTAWYTALEKFRWPHKPRTKREASATIGNLIDRAKKRKRDDEHDA